MNTHVTFIVSWYPITMRNKENPKVGCFLTNQSQKLDAEAQRIDWISSIGLQHPWNTGLNNKEIRIL